MEDRTAIRRVEWMRGGKEGPNLGWSVKVGTCLRDSELGWNALLLGTREPDPPFVV